MKPPWEIEHPFSDAELQSIFLGLTEFARSVAIEDYEDGVLYVRLDDKYTLPLRKVGCEIVIDGDEPISEVPNWLKEKYD